MCDYSLTSVKSRAAQLEDKLITTDFGTGTVGFADVSDDKTAICVLPGTEIAFEKEVRCVNTTSHTFPKTALFTQVRKDDLYAHHDALEFADGTSVLLALLYPGQRAKVLQLPAAPKTAKEAEDQRRVEAVG